MMMDKFCAVLLLIVSFHSVELEEIDKENVKKAIAFMNKSDKELNRLSTISAHANWNWKTNISEHSRKIEKEKASKAFDDFLNKVYLAARKFHWKRSFKRKNSTLYRWFQLAANNQEKYEAKDGNFLSEKEDEASPYSKMSEIFGKVKVCPPEGSAGECSSDVLNVFEASKDPKVLKHYWLDFRKQTGQKYKFLFIEAIRKENAGAQEIGYKNQAAKNIAEYEDKNFIKNIAEEMKKVLPFYKQIHAYVRKKLKTFFKNENIRRRGPIPAHLLGNIYAQKWNDIFYIVKPYPQSSGLPNVTKAMHLKKMKPLDMFIMAEKFFTSIGMPGMTPQFWHYSMFTKPENRDVECHASAHNFNDGKDYSICGILILLFTTAMVDSATKVELRIKMCSKVISNDLEVIHHEMGHIEFYMLYNHLPFLFRGAPNPGFHEAIGDAISLSVLTPNYWRQVGLIRKNEVNKSKESTINFLMNMALMYAVTLPYAYIIDHWRNKVYDGDIQYTEYNKRYWEYRLQYQGVCPPSKRTEEHFDIGAKYHIAAGVEYHRYYVANILQFQIHKVLCDEAGHNGPLHECNIYKNKRAGKAFMKFLSQGKSKKWKQLLSSFSGGKFKKLDVSPLLEYFEPLMDWLKKKNANEYIGWKSDDPMSCPGDDGGTIGSSTTNSDSTSSVTKSSDTKSSGSISSGATSTGITDTETTKSE